MRNLRERVNCGSGGAAAVVAVGLIALGLGGFVHPASAQDAEKDGPVRGRLGGAVAEAKAKGLTEATIHQRIERRTSLQSLRDIGSQWSVVLAEPVAAVTVETPFRDGLCTFYTFRTREVLRKQAVIPDPAAEFRPPRGVEPPRAGQVLLSVSGGDLRVRGVMVHQLGLRFKMGVEYILVVLLRGGDNVSWFTHPSAAALSVGPDGALVPLKESAFSRSLALAGVKDLSRLRDLLREPTR